MKSKPKANGFCNAFAFAFVLLNLSLVDLTLPSVHLSHNLGLSLEWVTFNIIGIHLTSCWISLGIMSLAMNGSPPWLLQCSSQYWRPSWPSTSSLLKPTWTPTRCSSSLSLYWTSIWGVDVDQNRTITTPTKINTTDKTSTMTITTTLINQNGYYRRSPSGIWETSGPCSSHPILSTSWNKSWICELCKN